MRILLTGAGGNLGTALTPMLTAAGHEPVLFDIRPLLGPHEAHTGDIRNPGDVEAATRGVDLVVHTAGIIGTQAVSTRDFYDVNLTGTLNVWEAAARVGVQGLVFSSTMSVYKPHDQPLVGDRVSEIREDTPPRPRDMYGYTKAAGEDMCHLYSRQHKIPSISLRYGMFSPEPFFRYGIRLLYGGVDVSDVARAVVASVAALAEGRVEYDVFNIESRVSYSQEDASQLIEEPLALLDKYYPGATRLLRERGVEKLAPIHDYYPIVHAIDALGWQPECNFERWLAELEARQEVKSLASPPWP